MKATKTNTLRSHHGESRSFRADKLMPSFFKGCGSFTKHFYKKKNRGFLKNDLHNQVTNNEEPKI